MPGCYQRLPAFLTLVLLCGCGGGSSGPSTAVATSTTPMPMSVTTPTQPFSFYATLDARYNDQNYILTTSETPNPGTVEFQGQITNSSAISSTVIDVGTGAVVFAEGGTVYFLESPFSPIGEALSVNGVQATLIVTSFTPFPANLTVGDSGPIESGTYYDANNKTIGTLAETYTVTANDSASVWLSVHTEKTVQGTATAETDTFLVQSSGYALLAWVQLTMNSATVTFKRPLL